MPDAYVMLPGADFPTVVCETGWSETYPELMDDVKLWLLYTKGQTRRVVVVKFTESREGSSPRIGNHTPGVEDGEREVGNDKSGVGSEGPGVKWDKPEEGNREAVVEDALPEVNEGLEVRNNESGDDSEEDTNTSEEQIMINSIDGSTNYHELAARLLDLNRRGGLREPLVGDLGATIHVFKASDDGKDIVETFTATLLPRPAIEQEAPTRFGITLDDLFGGSVPTEQNPKKVFWFSLERLEKYVTSSLPQTERDRASARTVKLLKEAGEWEERETYSQGKRRRLNMG